MGRAVAIRAAAASRSGPVRVRAASATPSAPATPNAGAPRTTSLLIASTNRSTSSIATVRIVGSAVWSTTTIRPSTQSIVRGSTA